MTPQRRVKDHRHGDGTRPQIPRFRYLAQRLAFVTLPGSFLDSPEVEVDNLVATDIGLVVNLFTKALR